MESTQHAMYLLTRHDVEITPVSIINRILNSQDEWLISHLLESFEDLPQSEGQAVLQNEQLCHQFLTKIATLEDGVENLISVLYYYQLPEKCVKSLARRDSIKRDIFDYLLRMEISQQKLILLASCIEEGTSLNQFFKVKTGWVPFGKAKDKLAKLNGLFNYYKKQQAAQCKNEIRENSDTSSEEQSISEPETFAIGAEEDMAVFEEEASYFSQAIDFTSELLNYTFASPKYSLLISAWLVGSAFYYFEIGRGFYVTTVDENDSLDQSGFTLSF